MKNRFNKLILKKEFLTILLILILCIAFSIANPSFFTLTNIFDLLKMCSYPMIFACGVMVVMIAGGIDMSFLWIGMFGAYTTSKVFSFWRAPQFLNQFQS